MKPITLTTILEAKAVYEKKQNDLRYYESRKDAHPESSRLMDEYKTKLDETRKAGEALSTACQTLHDAIREAEGRATARTVTVEKILDTLSDVEDHLGIPKSRMKGVKIIANPNAQTFPNAYKYTPEATYIKAEHTGKTWKITDIYRDTCRNTRVSITLTDEAKEAIIRKAETIH